MGVKVSNTVSVEVSATFLSIKVLTSALNGAPFSSSAAMALCRAGKAFALAPP